MNKKVTLLLILIAVGFISRILPHYPNFTAMSAVALIGGSMLRKPFEALIVTISALFLSDIIINNLIYPSGAFTLFYDGAAYTYGAYALIVFVGYFIKHLNIKTYAFGAVASMLLFFVITNFAVWSTGLMYPKTSGGLMAAYAAGVPYMFNDLAATLLYGVGIAVVYKLAVRENNLQFARV
jgi:hypothetical protein